MKGTLKKLLHLLKLPPILIHLPESARILLFRLMNFLFLACKRLIHSLTPQLWPGKTCQLPEFFQDEKSEGLLPAE